MRLHDLTDDLLTHGTAGGHPAENRPAAAIRVEYRKLDDTAPLPSDLLAVVRFGTGGAGADAPLAVDVELAPLNGGATAELWFASGPVQTGRDGNIRFACDGELMFAVIEEDERSHPGVRATAEAVYSEIRRFQQRSAFPHMLRMWNYLDAINDGNGDQERYRQFCVGRAQGLVGDSADTRYPAATAIGRQASTQKLQVFWLAGRHAGIALENPRQLAAYHYPRVHGPVSPSFSRATIAPDDTLLISGTASIVGHVSQHHGDALAQLQETLRNLSALTHHAAAQSGRARNVIAGQSLLKVYVRDPAHVEAIASHLEQALPGCEAIFVAADICRRELLIEIECVIGAGRAGQK